MEFPPFELERWLAAHEHGADVMLAESGVRSLPADRFDLDVGDLGYVIPTNGDPELRATVGKRYGRDADEVLFTCGTQEANFLAFAALLGDGGHAVAVAPTYGALTGVPEALGDVSRVWLEPPDWSLDPDAVADAIRPDTAVVVLANPNNPTGRYHDEEAVRALYDLAADADAFLLCDEVYRMLAPDPSPPATSLGPRALSTAGVSKAYGLAGARFGWLVGDRAVVERAWRTKDYTTISPSPLGQSLARQALADEDAVLAESRALAARNADRVAAFVAEYGLDWHRPTGVVGFVTVPDGFADARAFCEALVDEASVVLAPGTAFGIPDRFRVGFGLPTADLNAGLARIRAFLDGR